VVLEFAATLGASVLVPPLTALAGRWAWWPGRRPAAAGVRRGALVTP
jgi:uncharacterized membrane protein YdfJ with MMPL/SSD domain